jgi:hypothetical protein
MNTRRKEEKLLREWTRARLDDFYSGNALVINEVLSSPEYFQVVTEWETLHWCAGNLLTEAPTGAPAPCATDEVCSILQGLDDNINESESKLAKVVEAIIGLAEEFTPDKIKDAAEKTKADLGSSIDSATGQSNAIQQRSEKEKESGAAVDEIKEIISFFSELLRPL